MEGCQARLSAISQLFPEYAPETPKSRFWHIVSQPHARAEIICPQPYRANKIPYSLDSLNQFCTGPKGLMTLHREECSLEILDTILSKDDEDLDSANQTSFFCGSPPLRTTNPIVQDMVFVKQTLCQASPLVTSPGTKQALARVERVERGSPSCGSSLGPKPKVRIEGFTCGSSDRHCIVPAFA